MDALDLCTLAWGDREGYVALSVRDTSKAKDEDGYWRDGTYEWPAQREKIEDLLRASKKSKRDVYWSPAVYSKPRRRGDVALPTDFMWADLDEIDPSKLPRDLKPTAAWESSPGRFQALWALDTTLTPGDQQKLNQRLTYAIGADKGGWDMAQVLRVPGTHNHKYPEAPEVKLLWLNRKHVLSPIRLNEDLPEIAGTNGHSPHLPDAQKTLAKVSSRLNARAKLLIKARRPSGDRSATLWELECLLAERGCKAEQIAAIVQRTVWNKFKGRRDEVQRLLIDAAKAIDHAGLLTVEEDEDVVLELDDPAADVQPVAWGEFDRVHTPIRWLVADVWGESEVGFISGLPKSYKSWVALDLAVSVATGTRFLGAFQTHKENTLLIQEEDPRAVLQDRLVKVAAAKGLVHLGLDDDGLIDMKYDMPEGLYVISNQGFSIDESWLEQLEAWIENLHIKLVILDPLMMIAGAGFDEFKAFEFMEKVLKPLKKLRAKTQTAIAIVHHHTKGDAGGGAKGMYGSVALWAWEEAALHLQLESPGKVIAERFSKHSLLAPLGIEIGDVSDKWDPSVVAGEATRSSLLDLMSSMEGGMNLEELMSYTGLARNVLMEQLTELKQRNKVILTQIKRDGSDIPERVWKLKD